MHAYFQVSLRHKSMFYALQSYIGSGAPTQRNWNPNFYKQCELAGPQHRSWRKVSLQTMQVGVVQRNEFCENIIFVPSPDEHVY
ncbi:hypothetical protein F6R35_05560 [Staphylococcus aureus]|nr:hypothetical protein [Staphylococcus aureus]MCB4385324.1 hypothetical protein [Staphylococcus aureus]MCB4393038.1 hypothetical protein [Staphylococcus aureus]